MSETGKLPPLAGRLTDPNTHLNFTFEGRSIPALAGQSIGAALYDAGVRIFTRSFKYHRPRGLFCVSGDCPNCLMQVDGRPNVRTCIEPVRQGQVVRHQNAWPSLEFDVLRVFDKLDRFLPVGFYYKRFHKPRWVWPLFEHVVRHIAGLGHIDIRDRPDFNSEVEHLHAEVCVVGGGPTGMAAAREAAKLGADVLLLERQPYLGGRLLGLREPESGELETSLRKYDRARALRGTNVFGLYEGNLLAAFRGDRLLKIRAKQIIICTGSREQPYLFHNNDLPGIFLGRGVLRLAHLYGVLAGQQAVVATEAQNGHNLAGNLKRLGIDIAGVVDARSLDRRPFVPAFPSYDWPVYGSSKVIRAEGGSRLQKVYIARLNKDGKVEGGSEQGISCDLLCLASRSMPANELLIQGGMCFHYEKDQWLPNQPVPVLRAAGEVSGTYSLPKQILEGRLRGTEAAADLGYATPQLQDLRQRWETWRASAVNMNPRPSITTCGPHGTKCFVCLCEDVTEKDLCQAVAEGFDGIETLKRYSTVTMGPCQGKVCGQTAVEICARATGRDIGTVGTTTSRPPIVPVELSVLAAGQKHHPIRRTPLHHWHEAAGAKWFDAGQWKRPESYGDPMAEVRTVRNGVGLIDVSTLGKIGLIGPDAGELLERVYLNRWADLKIGRVRYGAMCNEDGILIDDGVGARLGPDRFYLTATTGNAEAIFEWLELWKATWRLNVTALNHTSACAAMNLAGPKSRQVLSRVTQLDVSPEGFPHLAMREGAVAGVACRLLRIGFVGELGYEIHCPSAYARHLWEALCDAGKEFGLQPFGVEAQRILRLEKGHLIIGQDTDALSNPLEAGLGWMVRFDKGHFHGREPLLRLKAMGPRSRLVGFQMVDGSVVLPEGCQVVEHGQPVGRLTSTRYSPTLDRSIGLAWVPAVKASAGERFFIRLSGTDVPAVVTALPFYDPQGKRLKS